MTEEKLNLKKKEIQNLGLGAIKKYFEVDIGELDKNMLSHLHQRAKIGMQFEKEMGIGKRAIESTYLRVFRMIAEDKKEIRKLIKKSIPEYLPR